MNDDRLDKIQDSVSRIERGLFGDSPMGDPGLVKRLGAVEGKVKNHERKLVEWGGIIIGASAIVSLVVAFLTSR